MKRNLPSVAFPQDKFQQNLVKILTELTKQVTRLADLVLADKPTPDALVGDIKIVLARDVDSTGVDWHKQLEDIRDLIKIHEKAVEK